VVLSEAAQERLDDGDLDAVFQAMRGEGMAQCLLTLLISSPRRKSTTGTIHFTGSEV